MYLKIKASLTPYQYSYSRLAAETGMPPIRAMALQFPEDASTYVNHTGTAYQFMSGDWLLVAPVYTNTSVRDGIYLPAGNWIDWWDDAVHTGPVTLDGYPAPLQKLPLFVRAGAIIPMWPPMLYFDEKKADPMTLELYPGGNSSFSLYEDDGVTRNATENAMFLTTKISMAADANFSTQRKPDVIISIAAASGKGFEGAPTERSWILNVHASAAPLTVTLKNSTTGEGIVLPEYHSLPSVDYNPMGWYFSFRVQGDRERFDFGAPGTAGVLVPGIYSWVILLRLVLLSALDGQGLHRHRHPEEQSLRPAAGTGHRHTL